LVEYYDYSKPGVLEATVDGKPMGLGHFTQVVWKATTKIGCAAVTCADGTLFTGYGEVNPSFQSCGVKLTNSQPWLSVNTKMQETSTSVREMLMPCSSRMLVKRSRRFDDVERVQAGLVVLMILIMDCELGICMLYSRTLVGDGAISYR
jgi:hypothetical protein